MYERNILTIYLGAFIDELYAHGVREVVISPGSRSTPLALLFADHPHIQTHVLVDERSAGFFALGISKKKGEPVGLVCTSGTAAANYFPAICEAYESHIPLIVMTADRPHELRGVGAPQTMNQLDLYGSFVKDFTEAAIPEDKIEMYHYVRTVAARSCSISVSKPCGPVHINMPFREPLVPNMAFKEKWDSGRRKNDVCETMIGLQQLAPNQVAQLQALFNRTEKGIILCGPNEHEYDADVVIGLAKALGYPILADPLSKLRSGKHEKEMIIECYDTFLRHEEIERRLQPEVVIRFGAMPVSKVVSQFLKKANPTLLVVQEGTGWREPLHLASYMIASSVTLFCQAFSQQPKTSSYAEQWKAYNAQTKVLVNKYLQEEQIEGSVVNTLRETLRGRTNLFVSNSMPIRDMDTFFHCRNEEVIIYGNRGINGIDGIVSTASGIAVTGEPVVLLIGDVSFYHDLNGLLFSKLQDVNLTIVVINNDGGGIFSFLPQSEEPTHFEKVFGTPLGLDYEHVITMYGGEFIRCHTIEEFKRQLVDNQQKNGLRVIEMVSQREKNAYAHRHLWNNVLRELEVYEQAMC